MLSEELNFTRAAERLKITQLALSKQISETGEPSRLCNLST
jgi:DNA-binding transcriptional LysR family regulator